MTTLTAALAALALTIAAAWFTVTGTIYLLTQYPGLAAIAGAAALIAREATTATPRFNRKA